MRTRTVLIFGLALLACTTMAQENQLPHVLAATDVSGEAVLVKYYTPDVYYEEGVNVYRRRSGEDDNAWTKLNAVPVRKGTRPSAEEFEQDRELRTYVTMLDSIPRREIRSLLLLGVIVKSFRSQPFSRYLGIQYDDRTFERNVAYEYRVTRIAGNREEPVGISNPVIAGVYTPGDPPQEIKASQDTRRAMFTWKPEEERYYAVNIYRSETAGQPVLTTKQPVMVSKARDTLGNFRYPEIFFTDDSLEVGKTYIYELRAIDFFGLESKPSASFEVSLKDNTPPPAPENLEQRTDHNLRTVLLTWKTVNAKDLAGYNVYRQETSDGAAVKINAQIIAPSVSTYMDMAPEVRGYYYFITAADLSGNEARSNLVFAGIRDVVPPAAPQNVLIRADTGKVVLTWAVNPEPDLLGYIVYRTINQRHNASFFPLFSGPVKENRFEDNLPRNARNKFLYKVVAVDTSFNKSETSAVASAQLPDATAPVKPFIKNITNTGTSLVIGWLPAVDNDIRGFVLFRISEGQTDTLALPGASDISYEDKQAQPGIDYEYFLIATDSAGNVSEPSNRFLAGIAEPTAVAGIDEVKAEYDSLSNAIVLTWKAIPKEVNGYIVYRREDVDEFRPITGLIQATEFVDSSIKKQRSYNYRIRAYDAKGAQAESGEYHVELK